MQMTTVGHNPIVVGVHKTVGYINQDAIRNTFWYVYLNSCILVLLLIFIISNMLCVYARFASN
jgi:uncharacterized integral membrane protein